MKKLLVLSMMSIFFVYCMLQDVSCADSSGFMRFLGVARQRIELARVDEKQQPLVDLLTFIIQNNPGPGSAIARATFYKSASWSWEQQLFAPTKIAFGHLKKNGIDLSKEPKFINLVQEILSVFDTHEEVEVVESESCSMGTNSSSYTSLEMHESFRSEAERARTTVGKHVHQSSHEDGHYDEGTSLGALVEETPLVEKKEVNGKFVEAVHDVMKKSRVIKRMQRKVTGNEEKDTAAFDQALKWACSFDIPASVLGRSAEGSGAKGSATLRSIATFEEESDVLLREALRLVDSIKALIEAERGEKDSLARLRSFEDSVVPTMATIQAALEARLGMFRMRMAAIQAEFDNLQKVMMEITRGSEHDLSNLLV